MTTDSVTYRILYALTDEFRDQHFAETGERPKKRQSLEVESTELSKEARKKIDAIDDGRGDPRTICLSKGRVTQTHRRVASVVRLGRREDVRISNFPKYLESNVSSGYNSNELIEFDRLLEIDDLSGALDRREREELAVLDEYSQALEDIGPTVIETIEDKMGVVEEDGSCTPSAVLSASVVRSFDETSHHERLVELKEEAQQKTEAYKKEERRRKEARREAKREKRRKRKAEKSDWIEAHGSDTLQRAWDAGYDCQRRYAIERATVQLGDAAERMYLDFDGTAEFKKRTCPSADALKFAEQIDGEVVWLTAPGTEAADEEPDPYGFEPREAVIKDVRLGEHGQRYTLIREF